MSDGNFPNGLIVKKAHQNAPAFIKCTLSFKVAEFIQSLQQNNNAGWVNMEVKLSQKGTLYAEIDNWQPQQQQNQYQQQPPQQGYQQQPPQQQQQPQYPQPNQPFQQPQQQPQQQAPPQQQPPQKQAPAQPYDSNAGFVADDNIPF